jgi:Acetyltransferase (GNAT) domain
VFQISSELTICGRMPNDPDTRPSIRLDSERTVMELVWPAHPYLASYVHALDRGWSPDNIRPEAGREERARISPDLPPLCLGHIGFSVVPWKRGNGYATRALALLLPDAAAEGLAYVELTTDLDNAASQAVIRANGGELVEQFRKPTVYGGAMSLRFRIAFPSQMRADVR